MIYECRMLLTCHMLFAVDFTVICFVVRGNGSDGCHRTDPTDGVPVPRQCPETGQFGPQPPRSPRHQVTHGRLYHG